MRRLTLAVARRVIRVGERCDVGPFGAIANRASQPRRELIGRFRLEPAQPALRRRRQHVSIQTADTASRKRIRRDTWTALEATQKIAHLLAQERASIQRATLFIYVVIRRRLLLAAQEAHETIGQQDQRQRNKDRHQRQHQETPSVQIAILDAVTWTA